MILILCCSLRLQIQDRAAEGTGAAHSGEEEAEGRLHRALELSERSLQQGGCWSLFPGNVTGCEETASSRTKGS